LFSKACFEDSETRQDSRLHLHTLTFAESTANLIVHGGVPTGYILVNKCL